MGQTRAEVRQSGYNYALEAVATSSGMERPQYGVARMDAIVGGCIWGSRFGCGADGRGAWGLQWWCVLVMAGHVTYK